MAVVSACMRLKSFTCLSAGVRQTLDALCLQSAFEDGGIAYTTSSLTIDASFNCDLKCWLLVGKCLVLESYWPPWVGPVKSLVVGSTTL